MTPLCHVTASIAVDDLLIIHTPTNKDRDLKGLVDSGATKNIYRPAKYAFFCTIWELGLVGPRISGICDLD